MASDRNRVSEKGAASARIARQHSGIADRVENCQIGVFLSYATPAGRTFLERVMSTKPVLAAGMIERALDAGIKAGWTTGDAVHGQHAGLRRRLKARGRHYVMAVPMNQHAISRAQGSVGGDRGRMVVFLGQEPHQRPR